MSRKKESLDQFEVIGRIPKGVAYQWCALKVMGSAAVAETQLHDFKRDGWKPVPAGRHPKMRRKGARIVVGDQILMERKASLSEAARTEETTAARSMAYSEFKSAPSAPSDKPHIKWVTSVASDLPSGPFEAQDIEIVLTLRLSANRVEAAAICGMSIERYAAVMATLLREGRLTGILIPTDDGNAFELKELLVSGTTEQ